MHIEKTVDFVSSDLTEDGFKLCIVLSDDDPDLFGEIAKAWDDDDPIELLIGFKLSDALETAITSHEMPAYENAIDSAAKPLFDAMRAELSAMIDRIDALKFAEHGDK